MSDMQISSQEAEDGQSSKQGKAEFYERRIHRDFLCKVAQYGRPKDVSHIKVVVEIFFSVFQRMCFVVWDHSDLCYKHSWEASLACKIIVFYFFLSQLG